MLVRLFPQKSDNLLSYSQKQLFRNDKLSFRNGLDVEWMLIFHNLAVKLLWIMQSVTEDQHMLFFFEFFNGFSLA